MHKTMTAVLFLLRSKHFVSFLSLPSCSGIDKVTFSHSLGLICRTTVIVLSRPFFNIFLFRMRIVDTISNHGNRQELKIVGISAVVMQYCVKSSSSKNHEIDCPLKNVLINTNKIITTLLWVDGCALKTLFLLASQRLL